MRAEASLNTQKGCEITPDWEEASGERADTREFARLATFFVGGIRGRRAIAEIVSA